MSNLYDHVRLYRAAVANPAVTKAMLQVYTFLLFAVPDTDGCHPSEKTIAAGTRLDIKTARQALAALDAASLIKRQRVRAGERVIGTLYTFPMASRELAAKVQTPPLPTGVNGGNSTRQAKPLKGENAPPIVPEETINRTGTGSVVCMELEGLCRQVQQSSAGPWRLDNARRVVTEAAARAGVVAVRELAAEVRGAGLRAWEITRRFEQLTAERGFTPGESRTPPKEAARPTVTLSAAQKRGIGLLQSESVPRLLIWYRQAQAAGVSVPMSDQAGWMPAIAESYLQTEYPRTYAEVTSAAA